jgi:hypothetical protein
MDKLDQITDQQVLLRAVRAPTAPGDGAPMSLRSWLQHELDDVTNRLRDQVFEPIPLARRAERPGGGNSINWTTLHLARHADLAISVLTGAPPAQIGAVGLGEFEPPDGSALDPRQVEAYAVAILGQASRVAAAVSPDATELEVIPNAAASLRRAGVRRADFAWLFDEWVGQPAGFFLRWPVIGHTANHVGEMIATRNRMGLSPH